VIPFTFPVEATARCERLDRCEPPLGLILCESAGGEQVELLQLGESGIHVATYLTDLPPKTILEVGRGQRRKAPQWSLPGIVHVAWPT
jgi:hypothetical protein